MSNKTIGQILRWLRHSRGLDQADLGAMVGHARSAISHYEHGKRNISAADFYRIVEALGYQIIIRERNSDN